MFLTVDRPGKHQSEFYSAISDWLFETCRGRSMIGVPVEEKGDGGRYALPRTGHIRVTHHLWCCLGRTGGFCLHGRDLDEWKEGANAFKSLLNSAQGN